MAAPLARVADPAALDACERGRAHLRVDVEAAWLAEGAELCVTVPARLACARCDGGGCDACARAGVLRAPAAAEARVVHAQVSARRDPAAGAALRIPDPFGAEHPIGQLLLELRPADAASAGVRRLTPRSPPPLDDPGGPAALPPLQIQPLAVGILVAFAAVLAALLAR
jgi:hypothetical protein